jgi:hypothetical protein
MPRASRHFLPGYVWHITHRCHQRKFLLKFARDRRRYLHWLFEALKSGNRQQATGKSKKQAVPIAFQSCNRFAPFKTFYKRIPKHCDVIEADNISRARLFY